VLPSLVSEYTNKYPKTRVEVLLTDRKIDLLSESVDLAIRAGNLKDSSLIAKKVGAVYFAPFASPKYLKLKGTPAHPRDLKSHRCLQFTPLGIDEWKLVSSKGQFNVPVSSHVMVNDLNMLKMLAVMGDGIVLLPTYFCYPEVKIGKLVRILPEWRTNLTPVHFVYAAQRFVTPKLSAFISLATNDIKKSFESFEI
jgi:DNA-binding transcriptional LysR family regulator